MKSTRKAMSLSTEAPVATITGKSPVSREDVAARAYELYAASGYQAGRDLEFWLEAERQLKGQGES